MAGPGVGSGLPYGGRRAIGRTLTDEEKKNMPKITKAFVKRILSYLAPYKWKLCIVFAWAKSGSDGSCAYRRPSICRRGRE